MKSLGAACFAAITLVGLSLVSCGTGFGNFHKSPKLVILDKDRYLYKTSYGIGENKTYALWDFYITGGRDELHTEIGRIPKGYQVFVKSVKVVDDLYGLHMVKMTGDLTYKGTWYPFEGKMTETEYRSLKPD